MRRGSGRSIRSRRVPIVRRGESRPRALPAHGRRKRPPRAHPSRLRWLLVPPVALPPRRRRRKRPPRARRPRRRKAQLRALVVRLSREGEAQVPAADFFVAVVVAAAEVVVRVLTRGRRRRVRESRRARRARGEEGGVGLLGHGVGGGARWRRGDHFVVFGVVAVVVGVAAGGVDGDEVVPLVEGAADQVEPAEEHGGSAYEEQCPYAIEL